MVTERRDSVPHVTYFWESFVNNISREKVCLHEGISSAETTELIKQLAVNYFNNRVLQGRFIPSFYNTGLYNVIRL